jgi:parallel beta-helix repeat protein
MASVLIVLLVLSSMLIFAQPIVSPVVKSGAGSGARTIVVPDDYPTIQVAINAANPGDTVYVRAGTYNETVQVNKSLSLVGEDRETAIIDGNHTGTVVYIEANDVNVTDFTIRNCGSGWHDAGIGTDFAGISGLNILGNDISNGSNGIFFCGSFNDVVANNISNAYCAIYLYGGSNNTMIENNLTNSFDGFMLAWASNNTIAGNSMATNQFAGVDLYESSGNTFYHNNFEANVQFQAYTFASVDVWDDGYPSGGNYWSDYKGIDVYSGPYQNQTGSDGIGDTPYVMYGDNIDHYPLMKPWIVSHDVGITNVALSGTEVTQGSVVTVNVTLQNYGTYSEYFNVTVYANTTSIFTAENVSLGSRESKTATFTWDTTGFYFGNYIISAHVTPVPGETDIANNTFIDGTLQIDIRGSTYGVSYYK